MNTVAILRAIEEVCLGTIGSIRTVTATSLDRDAYTEADDFLLAQRAAVNSRFEVELVEEKRTGDVGPASADRAILRVDLRIRMTYPTGPETQVDASARRSQRGAFLNVWETVRKALTWNGNLTQTSAGTATGIVSGCLKACGPGRVVREDWAKGLLVLEAPATALVLETQAVA